MNSRKAFWWILLCTIIALAGGFLFGQYTAHDKWSERLFPRQPDKIDLILDLIETDYVDSLDIQQLIEHAIPHFINELDPHSSYVPKEELTSANEEMEGRYGGIGIEWNSFLDTLIVVNVIPGSPSMQAGIIPGDRIIRVNDASFVGDKITSDLIFHTLRGEIGSPVKIDVLRNFSDTLVFNLTRQAIPQSSIRAAYEVSPGIGLIKIFDHFNQSTYNDFITAMAQLQHKGCQSFIIDLRMNRGGIVDDALNITNEFLGNGDLIMYAEGKRFPRNETSANGLGSFQHHPLVILIDQGTASASEIMAGAIQDNDRGLIVGRRSFGKGLIQNQIGLTDSSAIRLTIARYFTPSGRSIQRKYKLGNNHQYEQEWVDQLTGNENFHQDSLQIDSTLSYRTKNGRIVYGGGGIIPDLFIPVDTTHLSSYFLELENSGIFSQFAFHYADSNRAKLREYKDYQSMLDYLNTQPILYEITRFAERKGIKRRSNPIQRSAGQILTHSYAYIIRNFFGDEAFFPIYMSNDPEIRQAIEVINNDQTRPWGDIISSAQKKGQPEATTSKENE